MRYNTAVSTSATLSISTSGMATTTCEYTAQETMTSAVVTITLQKRFLGIFWTDVKKWTDTWTVPEKDYTRAYQLTDTGTYRSTVNFVFNGSGNPDNITVNTSTKTYS